MSSKTQQPNSESKIIELDTVLEYKDGEEGVSKLVF